jgi:hypothetical protein
MKITGCLLLPRNGRTGSTIIGGYWVGVVDVGIVRFLLLTRVLHEVKVLLQLTGKTGFYIPAC